MLSAVSLGGITYLDLSLKITVKLRYSISEITVFNVMVDMCPVCFRQSLAFLLPIANVVIVLHGDWTEPFVTGYPDLRQVLARDHELRIIATALKRFLCHH